jgi:hypothetical protein
MIIRIILIALFAAIILWFLGQRTSTRGQAWGKLGALLLFTFAIIAVLFPGVTTSIANTVGVGRGADLLLYVLTVAFFASTLMQYLHRQDEHRKLVELARHIAIFEANGSEHNTKIIENVLPKK